MWKNVHLFIVAIIFNLIGNNLQISTTTYLYDSSGTITSPGYPGNYPNNVNYTWVISTGFQQAKIYFSIHDFDIRKHKYYPCDDYLEIKEVEPCCHTLLNRCGKESNIKRTATGRLIRISFISDDKFTAKGFLMSWSVSLPRVTEQNTVKSTVTVEQISWTLKSIPETRLTTKLMPMSTALVTRPRSTATVVQMPWTLNRIPETGLTTNLLQRITALATTSKSKGTLTTNRIPRTTFTTKLTQNTTTVATTSNSTATVKELRTLTTKRIPKTTFTTKLTQNTTALVTTSNSTATVKDRRTLTTKRIPKTTSKLTAKVTKMSYAVNRIPTTVKKNTVAAKLPGVVKFATTLAILETKLITDGIKTESEASGSTSVNIYAVFFGITSATTLLLVVLMLFKKKKTRFPLNCRRSVHTASTSEHHTMGETYAPLQKSRKTCSDTYGVHRLDPDNTYLDIMDSDALFYKSTDELQNNDYLDARFSKKTESKTYMEIAECYV
ncbi:uncharacterized protein LOC134243895 [Saccostrea cucullata]|uniref:uncharacterized protein LOC134243895 n=1 Tax=Saccostrea cuccullata TaxID=36930 RepID=UPI002ED1CB18